MSGCEALSACDHSDGAEAVFGGTASSENRWTNAGEGKDDLMSVVEHVVSRDAPATDVPGIVYCV